MRITSWLWMGVVVLWVRGSSAADPPPPAEEPAAPATPPSPASQSPASQTPTAQSPATPSPAAPALPSPGEYARATTATGILPQLEMHGTAYFLYYQPLSQVDVPFPGAKPLTPSDRTFSLPFASLELRGRLNNAGVYFNPRFSDDKPRAFFMSNVWIQQVYAFYELPELTLKLGKIENLLSRLSDDTFYGSLPFSDGIKLDMDHGVSLEGSVSSSSGFGLGYDLQYFLVDGKTNGSIRERDTVWIKGGHRRHIAVLRLEPFYRFSSTSSVRFGVAGQFFRADLGKGNEHNVIRFAADMSLVTGPFRIFGEVISQTGKTVTDYPFAAVPATDGKPAQPGRASAHNLYGLAGAEVQVGAFTPRYSFSVVRYRDVNVTEILHIPGLAITLQENAAVLLEYGYWYRQDGRRSWVLDNSFNAALQTRF